jgi:hypothetical protein
VRADRGQNIAGIQRQLRDGEMEFQFNVHRTVLSWWLRLLGLVEIA